MEIAFESPGRPVTANQRLHWAEKRRRLAPWRHATRVAWMLAGRPVLGPSTVAITFPVPDRRRRDPSNLMPTQKAIIDELVACGMWPDDNPDWVTEAMPTIRVGGPVRIRLMPRSCDT